MEQTTTTIQGRKPIEEQNRKKPITIYVRQTDIKTIGGRISVRDLLNNYINEVVTNKTNSRK